MAYQIRCRKCEADTWVGNIHDLIHLHTAENGRLLCADHWPMGTGAYGGLDGVHSRCHHAAPG